MAVSLSVIFDLLVCLCSLLYPPHAVSKDREKKNRDSTHKSKHGWKRHRGGKPRGHTDVYQIHHFLFTQDSFCFLLVFVVVSCCRRHAARNE